MRNMIENRGMSLPHRMRAHSSRLSGSEHAGQTKIVIKRSPLLDGVLGATGLVAKNVEPELAPLIDRMMPQGRYEYSDRERKKQETEDSHRLQLVRT